MNTKKVYLTEVQKRKSLEECEDRFLASFDDDDCYFDDCDADYSDYDDYDDYDYDDYDDDFDDYDDNHDPHYDDVDCDGIDIDALLLLSH